MYHCTELHQLKSQILYKIIINLHRSRDIIDNISNNRSLQKDRRSGSKIDNIF